MLHTGKRSQAIAQGTISLLYLRLRRAGQASVYFKQQVVLRMQTGFELCCLVRAANEERRGCEQRQRKRDLRNHQRIARQKTPATPNHIFAGLFFQIADDGTSRKFQGWAKREAGCADKTETECHRKNGQARSAIPDDVERHQDADGAGEQPGTPNAQHQSADTSEHSEQQPFREQLSHNPPPASAQREAERDFFPTRRSPRE